MNTSISNAPVETSLTLMVSGGGVQTQDLSAGKGQGPSAFACLMASHCKAPGEANTATGAAPADGETMLMPDASAMLQNRLALITNMLGMGKGDAAAESLSALPQGLADGKSLPLPEIVAALAGAYESAGGGKPGLVAASAQLDQLGEQVKGRLQEIAELLENQGSDQMDPQLVAALEQLGLSLQSDGKTTDLPVADESAAVPLGHALGYHMLQQLSGPIGRHLGNFDGEGHALHVGLQLGHQLQQHVVGQGAAAPFGHGAEKAVSSAVMGQDTQAPLDAQHGMNLQLSQSALHAGQPQAQTAEQLPAQLVSATAVETAPLPMAAVATNGPATSAATTAPSYQAPPVLVTPGQPGWDQAMGERVMWMVGKDIQGAEVRINPPHLGPIEIRLALQHDQASVTFTAHHAGVREALESAIPRLREMLAENNLQLVNVDVGQRDRGEQHGPSDFLRRLAEGEAEQGPFAIDGEEGLGLPLRVYQSEGMVDFYA